jgi:hypothetical protein
MRLAFFLSLSCVGWVDTVRLFTIPCIFFVLEKRYGRIFGTKDQTNTEGRCSRNGFGAPQAARESFFVCSPQTKAEQKN